MTRLFPYVAGFIAGLSTLQLVTTQIVPDARAASLGRAREPPSTESRRLSAVDPSPYAAVGTFKGTMSCMASIVLHPRIIVTAAHCITERDGTIRSTKLSFRLGYPDGAHLSEFNASVWAVGSAQSFLAQSAHDAARDWAILLLDRTPEHARPFLLASDPYEPLRSLPRQILLPRYSRNVPGGQVSGIDAACSVRAMEWGVLIHDCGVSAGASGAPLLVRHADWYAVIGINTAALLKFDESQHAMKFVGNSAVSAWSFANALVTLVEHVNRGNDPEAIGPPAH